MTERESEEYCETFSVETRAGRKIGVRSFWSLNLKPRATPKAEAFTFNEVPALS
jgi:hypothetical protein